MKTSFIALSLAIAAQIAFAGSIAAQLPNPTGPHRIGTRVFHLRDGLRRNSEEDKSNEPRELIVQLWYPGNPEKDKTAVPYLFESNLLEAFRQEKYLDLTSDILDTWRTIATHAVENAPIIEAPKQLPLLLFSPGFGMARANYTAFSEDLASHGFIVAVIDHPYSGLMIQSGNRIISFRPDPSGPATRVETMADDLRFVLKSLLDHQAESGPFAAHIDPARVGALGHSIGGATALEACRNDNLFSACADLDGAPFGKAETEGVRRPFLVVLNEPDEVHRPSLEMREQRDKQFNALVSKQKSPALIIKVNGTNHFSFSDIPFLVPESLMKKNGASLTPARTSEITSAILRAFFSHFLNVEDRITLQTLPQRFSEITMQSFNTENQ